MLEFLHYRDSATSVLYYRFGKKSFTKEEATLALYMQAVSEFLNDDKIFRKDDEQYCINPDIVSFFQGPRFR